VKEENPKQQGSKSSAEKLTLTTGQYLQCRNSNPNSRAGSQVQE